jgi:hypothetical protein
LSRGFQQMCHETARVQTDRIYRYRHYFFQILKILLDPWFTTQQNVSHQDDNTPNDILMLGRCDINFILF